MQIVVTFDDMVEMRLFAKELAGEGVKSPVKPVKEKKEEPVVVKDQKEEVTEDTAEDVTEETTDADDTEGEKVYTLEEVRATLAALNKAGKKAEVQTLIKSFGAEKLSGISADQYGELMAKAGDL